MTLVSKTLIHLQRIIIFTFILLNLTANNVIALGSTTNNINLTIPYIFRAAINGTDDRVVRTATNTYQFLSEPLADLDEIRYRWAGTDLNVEYQSNPTVSQSFIKVYLTDDSSENNLIKTHGSSPLRIGDLAAKLNNGSNTILINHINSSGAPTTKIEFTFIYKKNLPPASIEILSPTSGTLITAALKKPFEFRLNNYLLSPNPSTQGNVGKLALYANDTKQENLITTITSGITANNITTVSILPIDLPKLNIFADSTKNTLIAQLLDSNGTALDIKSNVLVTTNFNGTLIDGLPRISIDSPSASSNVEIGYRLKLKVDNYTLLSEINPQETKPNTGYVQVRVNDNIVISNTAKTDIPLTDLKLQGLSGSIKIKAELVSSTFEKLSPPIFSEITINLKRTANSDLTIDVPQSSNWKLWVIIATVIVVFVSVLVLTIKG
jgi:hypothetical protein